MSLVANLLTGMKHSYGINLKLMIVNDPQEHNYGTSCVFMSEANVHHWVLNETQTGKCKKCDVTLESY